MRFLVFILLSLSVFGAEVDKGTAAAASAGGAATVTLTGCASANRVIVMAFYGAYISSGFTIGSSPSSYSWNSLTEDTTAAGAGPGVTVYYTDVVTFTSSEAFTVTPTGNVPGLGVIAICFTAATGAPSTAGNNTGAGTANSIQAGSVTPATGGDVFSALAVWAAPADPSLDQGFAITQSGTGFYGTKGWVAYLSAPSTSALDPTWSIPSGPHYIAVINLAFPAPASGVLSFSGVIE